MIASFLICTNVFNVHTKAAIRSCIQQVTEYQFEIVVVVNGDARAEISESLNLHFGNKIKVIRSELHGLINNLNLGLEFCVGQYIFRFDADDVCYTSRLQTQLKFMLTNPNIDVCYSNASIIDDEDRVISKYTSTSANTFGFLIFRNLICHPTVCFRKDVVVDAGGYRNKFACEDYDLWLRLRFMYKKQFSHLDCELICYRSQSSNGFRRNPSAYFNAARSKLEIGIVNFSVPLIFGSGFSFAMGCVFNFLQMTGFKRI